MIDEERLTDAQKQFGTNLEILMKAMAKSLTVNGVSKEVIGKAFLAGNAAVQMHAYHDLPPK